MNSPDKMNKQGFSRRNSRVVSRMRKHVATCFLIYRQQGEQPRNRPCDQLRGQLLKSHEAELQWYQPDDLPGYQPKDLPSDQPDDLPGYRPEDLPWYQPDDLPGNQPEDLPWYQPEDLPWYQPEDLPWYQPEDLPSYQPEDIPSYQPDDLPGYLPQEQPQVPPSRTHFRLDVRSRDQPLVQQQVGSPRDEQSSKKGIPFQSKRVDIHKT
eukprot:jgi/Botrbrau1/21665/Bobra.43_1s0064.1